MLSTTWRLRSPVAVLVVVVGRDDEGRVGDDEVEALAGDRLEQVALDEGHVDHAVEGGVEPGERERPGVAVGGGDAAGVAGGQKGLDPAARAHVEGVGDRAAHGQVRQRPRRGRDADGDVARGAGRGRGRTPRAGGRRGRGGPQGWRRPRRRAGGGRRRRRRRGRRRGQAPPPRTAGSSVERAPSLGRLRARAGTCWGLGVRFGPSAVHPFGQPVGVEADPVKGAPETATASPRWDGGGGGKGATTAAATR